MKSILEQVSFYTEEKTPTLLICPAYGKSYPTLSKLQEAWHEGLDFKIVGGPYTSIRDKEVLLEDYHEIRIYKSCAKRDEESYLIMTREVGAKSFINKPISF